MNDYPKSSSSEDIKVWAFRSTDEFNHIKSDKVSTLAEECLSEGLAWLQSQPKDSLGPQTDKQTQKAKRKEMKKHIREAIRPREDSYGCIFGSIILIAVLNAIISWVVRRLLDDYIFSTPRGDA